MIEFTHLLKLFVVGRKKRRKKNSHHKFFFYSPQVAYSGKPTKLLALRKPNQQTAVRKHEI